MPRTGSSPKLELIAEHRVGPMLVEARESRGGRSALAMWHLLSLDAPSVAAAWTILVARCAGLRLPWAEPAAMFVAVWMIYAADRLLDARVLDAGGIDTEGIEERHRFHHAHRRGFLGVLMVAALALVGLLHRVDERALHLYVLLATLLGVWMLLIHASGRGDGQRLPKEVAVGVFFPAAVFIPTVARVPGMREALLPAAVLFAGVCALNCLLLHAWEHRGRQPRAHWTTRWAVGRLDALAGGLLLLCLVAAALQRARVPAVACGMSVALLWGLDRMKMRMKAVHLRAAADLVLLTPLLWLRW